MRYNKKFYSLALAIALISLIILFSSTALACSEQTASVYSEPNTLNNIPKAYVANLEDINSISVIDTDKDKVIDNITVYGSNPFGVAVAETKTASKVYVVDQNSQYVSVFDTAKPHNVKQVPVTNMKEFKLSGEIAVSQDGKRAYLTGYDSSGNIILVINTDTDEFMDTIHLGTHYGREIAVAETKTGTKLYLTAGEDYVTVVDLSNKTIKGLNGFAITWGIAATQDGTKVYVVNDSQSGSGPRYVSVLDTATDEVLPKHIQVGNDCREITIDPNGKRAYVTNADNNTITVIDTTTNDIIGNPISVDVNPQRVAVNPEGTKVYVTNYGLLKGTVSVIDAVGDVSINKEIPVGYNPIGVAVSRR